MTDYTLAEDRYVYPTPGGAFHAVSTPNRTAAQRLLANLLSEPTTPLLTLAGLRSWSALDDDENALDLLYRAQDMRWLQGLDTARDCPTGALEDLLPPLLAKLGSQGKAVLADRHGNCLSGAGYTHEVAGELSALSAELADLHEHRSGRLLNAVGINSGAWGLLDAAGGSRLGFWPLYIGHQRFALAIAGLPRLNQSAFVNLVWLLSLRYRGEPPAASLS